MMTTAFSNNNKNDNRNTYYYCLFMLIRIFTYMYIHACISYKQISPIVRNNITSCFIYRLSNYGDLEYNIEEMSAIYYKKTFKMSRAEAQLLLIGLLWTKPRNTYSYYYHCY